MKSPTRHTPEAVRMNPTPTNDKPTTGSNEQRRTPVQPNKSKSKAPAKTPKAKRAANGRFA